MLSDLNYSNIFCTDLNPIRKNKIINSGYNKIKFKKTDVLNINFPDSSFDVVACKSMLGGIAKRDIGKMNIAINEI